MADQLPINFAVPGENIIASYDYTDISDGEGKVTYYLYTVYDTAATALGYKLGKEAVYTHTTAAGSTTGPDLGAVGETVNFNFETGPFNVPKIAEGKAIVNMGIMSPSGGGSNSEILLKLYHVTSGGSATQLGATFTSETLPDNTYRNIAASFTVPKTGFTIGEYIRLTVTAQANPAAEVIVFGADPKNQAGDYINPSTAGRTTVSTLMMPFRIDN